jgi:pimeloyl-ACP methyl ester carboxylesterase
VDALERELDQAGIHSAHIAGNSLGGWLALELARRGRARSVTALAPGGAWHRPADLRRLQVTLWASHAALRIISPLADRLLTWPHLRRILLHHLVARPDDVDLQLIHEAIQDACGCAVFSDLLATLSHDGPFAPGADKIDCPIVIAWAEADRLLPFERYIRPYLELLPTAEPAFLRGVGHVPMYDDPALVAKTILNVTRAADRREWMIDARSIGEAA